MRGRRRSWRLGLLVLLTGGLLWLPPAGPTALLNVIAQSRETRITATDQAVGDYFGAALALDGDLLAVGAPYADSGAVADLGAVYLFQRNPQATSGWTQIKKFSVADDESYGWFGTSVVLHDDLLIVGAPTLTEDPPDDDDNTDRFGTVYIYGRNVGGPDTWGLLRSLSEEDIGNAPQFGCDLAFDGDTLVVGAELANTRGAAFIYSRANNWQLVKMLDDIGGSNGDYFGNALAIDGDTLVVGAERADVNGPFSDNGAVFVFERNQGGANNWGQTRKLAAPDAGIGDLFGADVAVDGDTIVVGAGQEAAPGDDTIYEVGAAYLFERNQGGANLWGLVRRLAATDGAAGYRFGSAVAVAGGRAWVGAPGSKAGGYRGQGYVYAFGRDTGGAHAWGELRGLEVGDGLINDGLGNALAISDDQLVVGSTGIDEGSGGAYQFVASTSIPLQQQRVNIPLLARRTFAASGQLENGKSVTAQRLVIGAVEGTLNAPLPISILATTTPTPALTGEATPIGGYYQITAEYLSVAPADKPFLVGLPVPNGVDPATLALAVLSPPGWTTEGGRSKASWSLNSGSYDPATRLFVSTLSSLPPEGLTAVLISHPLHKAEAQTQAAAQPQDIPQVRISCWTLGLTSNCTAPNRMLVSASSIAAWDVFVEELRFRQPALNRYQGMFVGTNFKPELNPFELVTGIYLTTPPCIDPQGEPFDGLYHSTQQVIEICVDENPDADEIAKTARHELFHAIQYAYPGLAADWDNNEQVAWLIEGTATAAMTSDSVMTSAPDYNPWKIRSAYNDLTGVAEYEKQDFWVHYGASQGLSLRYLQPIFERGGTPDDIAAVIDLKSAYWEAVKNQVVEKKVTIGPPFTREPCRQELARTGDPLPLSYPTDKFVQGELTPLSAVVVDINLERVFGFWSVVADNDGDNADFRYKVYMEGEEGCQEIPEGDRSLEGVGLSQSLFVVVANVSLDKSFNFIVQVSAS